MMYEINRKTEPQISLLDNIHLPQPSSINLDNGIPVHLFDSGTQDIVKIECLFEAGKWHEDKPLIARFTNKMLKRGSENYTAAEIAEIIDYYGAYLESSPEMDLSTFSLYSLNKHLENTLPVFNDLIWNPIFPTNEFTIYSHNQKQKFIVNSEKVKYLARVNFPKIIFGHEHPYGRPFELNDFSNTDTNDLKDFHQKYFTPENCKLIVSGKLPNNIIDLLNKFFGKIQSDNPKSTAKVMPASENNNSHLHHIVKENTVQTALRIGKSLVSRTHPDFKKLKVLNTVLGGYFGSRLMTNIREDKGYTYGIGSGVVPLHHSGYFFIATEVGTEVLEKAIHEIHKEIEILQNDLIPDDELDLVRNYMLGSFVRSVDGAFAISESYRNVLEYELTMDYYLDYMQIIRTISSTELRDLANQYFQPSSLYQLRVGQ